MIQIAFIFPLFLVYFTSWAATPNPLQEFEEHQAKFHNVLVLPDFETSADAVKASMEGAMAKASEELTEISGREAGQVSFFSSIAAIDRALGGVDHVFSRIHFVSQTSTDPLVREEASKQEEAGKKWWLELWYRDDFYQFVKKFEASAKKRKLKFNLEDQRLLEEVLRRFRRSGMDLPEERREKVRALLKEVSQAETQCERNVSEATAELLFTKEELAGIPEDTLKDWPMKDGKIAVSAKTADKATIVLRLADSSETRRKMELARNTIARDANALLLKKVFSLRAEIANLLGYPSWAHYQMEIRMAKKPEKAMKFLNDLNRWLEPKLKKEMAEVEAEKRKHLHLAVGDPLAKLEMWDVEYYFNKVAKEKYSLDREALREFFPMEHVVGEMFDIYQKIFGVQFHEITPPKKWVEDLRLFVVTDRQTHEPMGAFYLDLYPREGKYTHFAQFGIVSGMRRADGLYERPTVALVCNFPKPTPGKPSLLSHDEVETLFHEFGHAMHSILTRSEYSSFSGTSVPADFVEAPSQMLENWVWDQKILGRISMSYKDPSKKMPLETLKKLDQIRLAEIARSTRRQISFGLMDQEFHSLKQMPPDFDPIAISNQYVKKQWGLDLQPGYAFVTRFMHLVGGYDAGYYGYLWSELISADFATRFQKSAGGFLDIPTGMKLRKEVYAPGNSRPVEDSVRAFLGREPDPAPFRKKLGL